MGSTLPSCHFFKRQIVPLARLLDREKAPVHCGDHLPLPSYCPAAGIRRRQILKFQPVAKWPNYARRSRIDISHVSPSTEKRCQYMNALRELQVSWAFGPRVGRLEGAGEVRFPAGAQTQAMSEQSVR